MQGHDVEHEGISSESSESSTSYSYSEREPLIDPSFQQPDYKSLASSQLDTSSVQELDDNGGIEGDGEESGYGTGSSPQSGAATVISLLLIGVFISNADSTLVMATYTTISSEFGSFGNAAWLTTSFTLALCAAQPIVGKLSDIYGRKGVLLASYGIFAVGSLWTGMALSMAQVVAGRIVSGCGAAGMGVIVSVLIADLVPLIKVASWRSYVNVFATFGRSIGGPLGGLLADTVGWRWSFIGQGPLILLAILLVSLKLPSRSGTEPPQRKGYASGLRRVDFIGALLLSSAIVSFLGALSLGGQDLPWSHPLVLSLSTGSLLLGAIFVLWETKWAFEPIFPPSLLIQRHVATPYAIMALQSAAQLAMMFSVPLYFRVTANASDTVAGSHLFPAVLGNTAGGLLAGFTIQRTGNYKKLTILATVSSSITYTLLITRWRNRPISFLESLVVVPGGFGTGIAGSATFIALTASVSHADIAVTTGGMYLSAAIGMLAGIAVSNSVQLASLRGLLNERLEGVVDNKADIIETVISNVSAIRSLEENTRDIVVRSYVKSLEYSHWVSLGFAILALSISFTIRERPLR